MGNCVGSASKTDNIATSNHISSDPGRISHRTASSSLPSFQTSHSAPSNLTTPSSTERSYDNLLTPQSEREILSSSSLKSFTFSELKSATRNFRPDSLIGEGGFGYVYKGWIDEHTFTASRPGSGIVVAVKKLKPGSFQGHKEWVTEVHYLSQFHHENLVRLIGYCSEGDDRLLVYEYMPKGSLENHLLRKGGAQPLSWQVRIKIAIGAARGLSFLHDSESQVIYRDVKASNILLDSEFNPKLSDFGLAKAGPTGDRTHVSTQIMGTQGYAAPEYVATGRLTTKADVYSFGVVLLELLSGRRVVDKSKIGIEQNLVDWAKPYLNDKRKLYRIMDTKLEGQYAKNGAFTVATLALQCLRNEAKTRPKMCDILTALEQLQHSKDALKHQQHHRIVSSTVGRSPGRHQHPSRRTVSNRSPLHGHRQSVRVH